jgi:hypothetical protein
MGYAKWAKSSLLMYGSVGKMLSSLGIGSQKINKWIYGLHKHVLSHLS